jgi:hypothetical protein
VAQLKYLGMTVTNQILIQEELKSKLTFGNASYNSEPIHLLSKDIKIQIYKTVILPVVLCGCET